MNLFEVEITSFADHHLKHSRTYFSISAKQAAIKAVAEVFECKKVSFYLMRSYKLEEELYIWKYKVFRKPWGFRGIIATVRISGNKDNSIETI